MILKKINNSPPLPNTHGVGCSSNFLLALLHGVIPVYCMAFVTNSIPCFLPVNGIICAHPTIHNKPNHFKL